MHISRRTLVALVIAFGIGGLPPARAIRASADSLPSKLSDQEFWQLSQSLSEDDGYFRSDNLVSNEQWFQTVIPELLGRTKPGGVYLGVGPEQNFTYIAALAPKLVFITDIRRGNLHTHLMYKALFELSADRADFMSRLFTKKRPGGLDAATSAHDLQQAYWDESRSPTADAEAFKANVRAIADVLTKKHHLPLSQDDLDGIEAVYHSFYWYGPSITYSSSSGGGYRNNNMASFAQLMEASDNSGATRSFLATEAAYRALKELESKNLIVPVIGDFGGPKALRAVGEYVRDHGATVTAFYLSNVEQYLYQDGKMGAFCANVASMPLDASSTFIRSLQGSSRGGLMSFLGSMQQETTNCAPGRDGGMGR